MNKKAQGISINTIIIAAIALIVLVVLVAIFTGRLGTFVGGVENCKDKGGECKAEGGCAADEAALRGTNCAKDFPGKPICCILVKKETPTTTPSPPSTEEEPPIPPG